VLVHAAGSGVSSAAIQIAKLFGAKVIATTASEPKLAHAQALGADHVIHTASCDFVAEVKRLTGKRGADLVIEHVGGETLSKTVLATASGGRIVTCGATSGHAATIDLRHVFFRQIEILGSTMGSKGALFRVLEHVAAGRLRPVVDRTMPLWEAREAHRALEAREVFGKIVLDVD
jgi:NADPH:quinone reductase-like Zn-dependent oxidoreductase